MGILDNASASMAHPDLLWDAMESLTEGLAIYGPDCRLVAFNRRYPEMLHPVADLIVPGVLWPDLLRACAERGVYANPPEDIEEWLDQVAREPLMQLRDVEVKQADGRTYRVSHRPTRLGGFVITRTDITARREAEARAREREALLGSVLDTIPVAIVMVRIEDGRIIYRSKEAQRDFPRGVRSVRDILLSAEEWPRFVGELRRTGRLADHKVDVCRGDGSSYYASITGRMGEAGDDSYVVLAISDLTEKLGQEELLRHVVDACPTPLMMTQLESGEVLFSSPEARALFGEPETSKVLYVEPEARERYVEELKRKGSVQEYKVHLQKQNGERFWSASSSRVIRYRGSDVIVAHMRDLTDQLAIEAELAAERERAFQNEKLTAMGELLAGVAHELNNPLSVILGRAQLLLELETSPDAQRHAEQVGSAAERCARIVKTFLTMARQQPTKIEPVSINEIARSAASVARYGEGNKAQIDCDLARGLPSVAADADQITQVIINLLLNAEQAMSSSRRGDHIVVRTRLAASGDTVMLEVEDNGPGIPVEIRGRIFEPFFTTKDVGKGTGVGLALSHRIVRSHSGELQLDDDYRDGCRFCLSLPVMGRASEEARADAPWISASRSARILIVDDEVDLATMNGEILALCGYEVDVTHSALEAISKIRQRRYDLVVSDLSMPGMDGRGLFEAIASEYPNLAARTAFLTGDTMGENSQRFLQETGRPCLEKPVTPRELCEFVDGLLDDTDEGAS